MSNSISNIKCDNVGELLELLYKANPDEKCIFAISNPFAIDFTNPRVCFIINDSPTKIWEIIDYIEKKLTKPLPVNCYVDAVRSFTMDSPFCFEWHYYIDEDSSAYNSMVIDAIASCIQSDSESEEEDEEQMDMTIEEMKDLLQNANFDFDIPLPYGFHKPHSYREYYDEVAFEPTTDVSINSMLDSLEDATQGEYIGYKGGEFYYSDCTLMHIANYGCGEIPGYLNKIIKCIRNFDIDDY